MSSLEITLALAILCTFTLASAATFGLRPPRAHAAALALEAAVIEARSLATTTADETDPAATTGATVYVAPDPQQPGRSIVSVYRSRPIVNPNAVGASEPLLGDAGFPPQRVAATLTVRNGDVPSSGPFAILISSSGYASVAAPLDWDPGASGTVLATDPGCTVGAVSIVADDGSRTESHPLACRNAVYDASR
jgi:hypothetical protein